MRIGGASDHCRVVDGKRALLEIYAVVMTEVRPSEGSSGNLQAESDALEKKIHHYGSRVPLTAAQVGFRVSANIINARL